MPSPQPRPERSPPTASDGAEPSIEDCISQAAAGPPRDPNSTPHAPATPGCAQGDAWERDVSEKRTHVAHVFPRSCRDDVTLRSAGAMDEPAPATRRRRMAKVPPSITRGDTSRVSARAPRASTTPAALTASIVVAIPMAPACVHAEALVLRTSGSKSRNALAARIPVAGASGDGPPHPGSSSSSRGKRAPRLGASCAAAEDSPSRRAIAARQTITASESCPTRARLTGRSPAR